MNTKNLFALKKKQKTKQNPNKMQLTAQEKNEADIYLEIWSGLENNLCNYSTTGLNNTQQGVDVAQAVEQVICHLEGRWIDAWHLCVWMRLAVKSALNAQLSKKVIYKYQSI